MLALLEWVLGFVLALVTLHDVFGTVVVPGRTSGLLKVSRRLVFVGLPLWKRVWGPGIGVNFAPALMVAGFVIWVLLLVLAFALMVHALSGWFSPPLTGFGAALYSAATAVATIGTGASEPSGPASVVVAAGGFCGLAVMTMAVTYLLEVQANIGVRDTGVLKITTASGDPPSAVALLEKFAALGCREELSGVLRDGRHWCATMLQSHASHPWLIYFRSAGVGAGWPATVGTLMDLALVLELLVDEPGTGGLAVLVREEAGRVGHDLAALVSLRPAPLETRAAEVGTLCSRLEAAGYRLRPGRDAARFQQARAEHVGCIEALSHHLGTPAAPLLDR